jgi:gluconate 2-dehydrogenase subunit 3-like protein
MTNDPENWLIDPDTGKRMDPVKHPGYYPGYSTMSQKKFWDAATRTVVEKRVSQVPPIRFFEEGELQTIAAVCNRILPQDDRLPEWQIPIVNYIDDRLFSNRISGYRFEGMPADQEVYRLLIQAIDQTALALHRLPFVELDPLKQDFILKSIHDGKVLAAEAIWQRMTIHRVWELLVQDCISAYYAHPWTWDEIGYGGPAYPRAYMRLENGEAEPWEVDEQRYEWAAPPNSISDRYDEAAASSEQSHHGQGGTH